ncbi:MAG: PD40 domain-containing protein, partial [Archangium sp.]|nr:PD40 domain-containing protein [Archangium sp.]
INDEAGAFEPSIAPDGKWFAFVSSVDGDAEIYRAAMDGGARVRLTAFHLDDVGPRVSPDGKWVVFTSNREGSDRLFLIAPDGRGTRRLHPEELSKETDGGVEAAEADAVWTPDGKSVVFSARAHGGNWHLFRVALSTGKLEQLTEGAHDDQLPAVSPDGKWIAFVSSRAGNAELFALAPDGGTTRITTSPKSDWKPLWLPR